MWTIRSFQVTKTLISSPAKNLAILHQAFKYDVYISVGKLVSRVRRCRWVMYHQHRVSRPLNAR